MAVASPMPSIPLNSLAARSSALCSAPSKRSPCVAQENQEGFELTWLGQDCCAVMLPEVDLSEDTNR
jgi:hypothetical protein